MGIYKIIADWFQIKRIKEAGMNAIFEKKRDHTDTKLWQEIVMVCLIVIVCGNLMAGAQGFLLKGGGTADDFTMRYRESKYVASGINPFDVITGLQQETEIGSLWDLAGYTPWGMAYGILINFTFLPEKYARYLFCAIYLCIMFGMAFFIYRMAGRYYGKKMSTIFALLVLSIPGWGTGLDWLNFGALFGAAIFMAVAILDQHPVAAGILFGLAATKPQLAMPFYLGLLLRKQYKTLVTAVVLPICAWAISLILTGTGPLEMLIQYQEIIKVVGGQLGNWASSLSTYYNSINFAAGKPYIISVAGCIILAIYVWHIMYRNGIKDHMSFFSVAAVCSGMWTYSQAHDRTVLMIVIMALVFYNKDQLASNKKLMAVFLLSLIADTYKMGCVWSYFSASGTTPSLVLDLVKYLIWVSCLFFLAQRRDGQGIERT